MHDYKNDILQLARAHQYRLHPFAMKRLSEFLNQVHVDESCRLQLLKDLFVLLQKQCLQNRFVDHENIENVIGIQVNKIRSTRDSDVDATVQMVSLQQIPKVNVDEVNEELKVHTSNSFNDRLHALRQRYLLARRRCLRSGLYRKDMSSTLLVDTLIPLLPIAALEGLGSHLEVAVLGLLVKRGSEVFLEDLRGEVRLELQACAPPGTHCFVGEGFMVIAVGRWVQGVLCVARLELPPAERRAKTMADVGQNCDLFGLAPADIPAAAAAEKKALQSVIIFMAEVHLDNPATMQHLGFFFRKMQERTEPELSDTTFVMTGNFSSIPLNYGDVTHMPNDLDGSIRFRTLLDALAQCVVANAPLAAQHSTFVIVPGPHDMTTLQGFYPQPPIPLHFAKGLKSRLKKLQLAPNPCRLRFFTHEIILARRNFMRALQESEQPFQWQRSTPGTSEGPIPTASFDRIAKTVLDEAHLSPDVRGRVLWRLDDALRIPIAPHTLLLCDSTEQWESFYKGVHIVNPGSFTVNTTFLWYTPADGECSLSSLE